MAKIFPGQTVALKKRLARKAVAAKVGGQLYSEVDLPHNERPCSFILARRKTCLWPQ